jgi:nicotinamide-nucleotide amidase
MIAEIIAAGSEMLTPHRQDTNSLYLTAGLNDLGVTVAFKTIVGDSLQHLTEAARIAVHRADIVIFSGGLGPTEDDLTREAVAAALGLTLRRDSDLLAGLYQRYAARSIVMPPNNAKQADVLAGAEVLDNPNGSAAGQFLALAVNGSQKIVILLPGPPKELKPLFDTLCKPRLAALLPPRYLAKRLLRMALLPESQVDARTAPIYKQYEDVETTILAHSGEIQLHFLCSKPTLAEAEARVNELTNAIEQEMDDAIFSAQGESLEEVVLLMLGLRHLSLASAESCTGGLLAERLTAVPGSSRYFLGGAVVYSDPLKTLFAGVPEEMIATHGHPQPHRGIYRRRHHRHRRPRTRLTRPGRDQAHRPGLHRRLRQPWHPGEGAAPARRPRTHPLVGLATRPRNGPPQPAIVAAELGAPATRSTTPQPSGLLNAYRN